MTKTVKFDESGDSDDLQSLFDSIAASTSRPIVETTPIDISGDSDELQDLFDSVAADMDLSVATEGASNDQEKDKTTEDQLFNRLGHMTRLFHDSLHELGYDRVLEETARKIPDARERLNYIAKMTEDAASKVLNAIDIAQPLQDSLLNETSALNKRWEKMFSGQITVDEFKALAVDTRAHFKQAPANVSAVTKQLTEIMMAQDFQDLTGQVVRKIVDMVQGFEAQLVNLLIEAIPEDRKPDASSGLLNGPVINTASEGVMTSQDQVDDLLESLGF